MSAHTTLSETAARWYIRMRDAAPDAPERSQFEAWLMADSAHQAEYESISATMQQLNTNKTLKMMADAVETKAYFDKNERKRKLANAVTKTVAVLIIGLAAMFSVQQYHVWQTQPVLQVAANNTIGKITTQSLSDGSKITLSANSEMQITYYRHQRYIRLNRGEAIFDVAKDEKRPFVVESANAKITVLGTRFAVNKLSNLVRVSVEHGRVQVEAQAEALILSNGQVAEIKLNQAPEQVQKNALDAFGFAQGKLIFAGADIQEIADTIARYRQTPIIVQGLPKSRTSAVINTKDAEQFLQGLPNIAPVQIMNQSQKTIIVEK